MAREMGADLVEYRVDEFFSGGGGGEESASLGDEIAGVVDLVSRSPVACIATCRPTWEGGAYDGPEDARVSLFEALGTLEPPLGHPPRYIDFELAAYEKSANVRQKVHLAVDHPERGRSMSPSLILSIHDFEGRPADFSRRVLAAQRQEACRVVKVAYRARSLRDNLELFDVLAARERPTIALGMGEFGLMSRVLAGKFGGFLTFASLRKAEVTAPGQPTIRELLETYRFRSIGSGTRVYGVVGWPVGHSMSPAVHNAGFGAVGHDGVYVPLPIAAGEDREASYVSFKATMRSLMEHEGLGFAGCSVTLPHKENLVRLAGEMSGRGGDVRIDDEARLCGAGNTLVRDDAGVRGAGGGATWRVMNTDASAARACLEEAMGSLEGKRVVVVGAGGVGRTIAAACVGAGAEVRLLARDGGKAEAVAQALRERLTALESSVDGARRIGRLASGAIGDADWAGVDAVVNATPVGMAGGPAPDGSVIDVAAVARSSAGAVVFDTVYNPAETALLGAAREAGLATMDGVRMFVRQAALQFEAWTGQAAPVDLFERVVRERLAGVTNE